MWLGVCQGAVGVHTVLTLSVLNTEGLEVIIPMEDISCPHLRQLKVYH